MKPSYLYKCKLQIVFCISWFYCDRYTLHDKYRDYPCVWLNLHSQRQPLQQRQVLSKTVAFWDWHFFHSTHIYIFVFVYLVCDDRPYAVSIWRPSKNSLRAGFRSPGKQRPAQERMTSLESFFCTYKITAEEESSKHFQGWVTGSTSNVWDVRFQGQATKTRQREHVCPFLFNRGWTLPWAELCSKAAFTGLIHAQGPSTVCRKLGETWDKRANELDNFCSKLISGTDINYCRQNLRDLD